MAAILLEPSKDIEKILEECVTISVGAGTLGSLYSFGSPPIKGIVDVTNKIVEVTAKVIQLQAMIPPIAIQPPSIVGVNNPATILTLLNPINSLITTAATQSTAASGGPSPTFLPAAAAVTTALEEVKEYANEKLVKPLDF